MLAVGKAHQRVVRERRANAGDADLFGRWWVGLDTDIKRAEVRPVSYRTAEKVILEYEWLGTMPAVVWHSFGIYFDNHLGGVVCFGPEYGENLGIWDRYGYTGKIITLSRGACVHWAHPHAGSALIRRSMALLPARFTVVTATTDERAGEVGTLYQACNFAYVGVMAEHNAKQPRKALRLASGTIVGERAVRQRFGSIRKACAILPGSSRIFEPYKARYFGFIGSRTERQKNRAAIAHLIKPYPKRAGSIGSDAVVNPHDRGRCKSDLGAPPVSGDAA